MPSLPESVNLSTWKPDPSFACAWREHKQIKMSELAKNAGISSAYLSQIENGKRNPKIDTLKAIAKGLNLDIEFLI